MWFSIIYLSIFVPLFERDRPHLEPLAFVPLAGIIITTHDKLAHYLGMLTHQAGLGERCPAGC